MRITYPLQESGGAGRVFPPLLNKTRSRRLSTGKGVHVYEQQST
jgi:hypothetical protein